jgi:aspartate-semialdehyde dehydrogenase
MKLAIIGATGAVGREILAEVQRYFPEPIEVGLFASHRSAGQILRVWNRPHVVQSFSVEAARGYDFILMSAGSGFSKEFSPELVKNGSTIIDNSSAWRMDPRYPLIVPEVNPEEIVKHQHPSIFPNGNCSTIQLAVVLGALKKAFGLTSVVVSSYQSVSGAGQKGIDDLEQQVRVWVNGEKPSPRHLPRKIAFDLIPAIDRLDENGHCFEETKIVQETRKILEMPTLPVFATTIRVPTFRGHGEAVMVEVSQKVSKSDVEELLRSSAGIRLHLGNDYEGLPLLDDCIGNSDVHVSRVRLPFGEQASNRVMFWNISDNLYKGAASNAVQILKLLIERRS